MNNEAPDFPKPKTIDVALQKTANDHVPEIHGSSVQTLVDGIIRGVRTGLYHPGDRLVAANLAAQFNVSRAPVREALAVLVGEGVVEIKPNSGAKIRKLSTRELIEIMEFTEAALLLGVRLCAARIHDDATEQVTRLDAEFARVEDAWRSKDPAEFVDGIHSFHNVINEIGGNQFLEFVYKRPHFSFFNRQLTEKLPGRGWDQYLESYRRVHLNIRKGNVHASEAAFSAHMQWAISLMSD